MHPEKCILPQEKAAHTMRAQGKHSKKLNLTKKSKVLKDPQNTVIIAM